MEDLLPAPIKEFFKDMIRARLSFDMSGVSGPEDGPAVRKALEDSIQWVEDTGFPHLESTKDARALLASKTDPELVELFHGQPSRLCLNLTLFQDVRPLRNDLLSRDGMARVLAWAKSVPRKETDPQVTPYVRNGVLVVFVSPVVSAPPGAGTCPLYFYNVPALVCDTRSGFAMGYPPLAVPEVSADKDGRPQSTRECNACVLGVVKHCVALAKDPAAVYVSPMGAKEEDGTVTYTRVSPPAEADVAAARAELFGTLGGME